MACNDEELSTIVHKYEVLFDKSHADFRRINIKRNAWRAVSEELHLEDG